jgi:hypothetical protein
VKRKFLTASFRFQFFRGKVHREKKSRHVRATFYAIIQLMKFFSNDSVLRSEEFTVVLAVLIYQRKASTKEECERAAADLGDVLLALRVSGHCVVPCGAVDALKKSLLQYGTEAIAKEKQPPEST